MSSVTERIAQIKQPRGGYIKPSTFETHYLNDGIRLNEKENIHGSTVGMVVDYMTRFQLGTDKSNVFCTVLDGAERAELCGEPDAVRTAKALIKKIKGVDDASIRTACRLVFYDVWKRNPMAALAASERPAPDPDGPTIQNIQTMIRRSIAFFDEYGPRTADGFTFEPISGKIADYDKMIRTGKGCYGGYTPIVDSGDGDFLTQDTLWDFKVIQTSPTSKHTLQLLMYWIMGKHSGQPIFQKIRNLGIFNPRLNLVYLFDMKNLSKVIVQTVETEIIGYEKENSIYGTL